MDMPVNDIGNKIFTEAGVLAFVLFWLLVYTLIDNRSWRRENRDLNKQLVDMGMRQIEVSAETNNVIEKLSDTLDDMEERKCDRHVSKTA